MAFEDLNLASAIWRRRGISHICQPEESVRDTGQTFHREARKTAQAISSGVAQKIQRSWQAPPERPEQTIKSSAPSQMWRSIPVEKWPQIWQEQLKNTKGGRVAWTYWNLGADLLAARYGDRDEEAARQRAARSRLMRRILGDLNHPSGIHTFWPLRLGLEQDAPAEPELFWSGLQALGCRCAIIMGSNAASAVLSTRGIAPHMQFREKGILAWPLHNIDSFPEEQYASTLVFLRQSLSILMPTL